MDEPERLRSVERVARSQKRAPHSEAGGRAVEAKRAMGAEAGGPIAEGGDGRISHRLGGRELLILA